MAPSGRATSWTLSPERDVELRDGRFHALSAEPWLTLDPPDLREIAGRIVEITYRLSLWDEPVRPIFRFWRIDSNHVDAIASGPTEGAGIWIGRVPDDTRRLSVSPTNRRGPFDFCIERLRERCWLALIGEGLRRNPRATRSALLTRVIGWRPESDVNLAWAIGGSPLSNYPAWSALRRRPIDVPGLDRPRVDRSKAPAIRIVVTPGDGPKISASLKSLREQVFPNWTASVFGPIVNAEPPDPRIAFYPTADVFADVDDDPDGSITCVLAAGDRLTPPALAHLIEQAFRNPSWRVAYGDHIVEGEAGLRPSLRSGWSSVLHASRGLEPPVFVKDLKSFAVDTQRSFLKEGRLTASSLVGFSNREVMALRRILLVTRRQQACVSPEPAPGPVQGQMAVAAVIIPTRDHPALLRRAVASVRARSRPGSYRIVVADNGSETREAKELLAGFERDADILRLDHPGPFNFSAICNAAAAAATGDVLVFLNDDTEVLTDGWLDRLMKHAMLPGIGAVGAKLTYPDGRLQHIGVVVGMGGGAGHFGALDVGDAPGWQDRNLVPHEVSAVTGACLAVERVRFDAVGGFDAEHLPVELSDVDLCLKLNAWGWQSMIDPTVHVMHEESASRGGATLRRLDVYGAQRAVFVERWRHVMRDDPFFHPALSLYSWRAALG